MLTKYLASLFFLAQNILCLLALAPNPTGASHIGISKERLSDGTYRPKDYGHITDDGHNVDFDHEAIIGSLKEAEEYDHLSPEESQQKLSQLLPKMDINEDKFVDQDELKKWILNSFINLSKEEAEERMSESDTNKDGEVSWAEWLQDAFAVDAEEDVSPEGSGDVHLQEEKAMWRAADLNGDGKLDLREFEIFNNPEDHPSMHSFLVNQTMREKDANGDGRIDFMEYVGERGSNQDKEWQMSEREKFEQDLDLNGDGVLDEREIHRWIIPDNNEIAEEEVEHLFASADEDRDNLLSYEEILRNYNVFVGSEGADPTDNEIRWDEL